MKHLIKIFILFLLNSYLQYAQVLDNYESNFKTLFDKKEKVNPYYFGYNPAWLGSEVSNELLFLKSNVNYETGDFKKFTDPGNIRYYSITATGKKLIDSSQIFRGSFGFQRTENNNWQWFFTRDYSSGSPFLIGDSTSGNTRMNGIIMSAEYAANIFDKFNIGLSLKYNVDEGLKFAHPRPTSKDREINFNAGMAYKIDDNITLGLKASVYDNIEHIDYSQDPGILTTEIILIKFRGFDFPNVFRMTTESRYSYNNGYSAGLNFLYDKSPNFKLTAFADAGFNKINVKDGDINPLNEGFWKNNSYNAGLASLFKLNSSTYLSFLYKFELDSNWAEFPPYNVVYSNNSYTEHSVMSGVEYSFDNNLTAGLEAGIKYISNNFNDYYSHIFSKSSLMSYILNLGLKTNWSNKLSSFVSIGYNSNNSGTNSLNYTDQSSYFTEYRIKDLYLYQTGYKQYLFNLITAYSPGFGGEILINLNYSNSIPGNSTRFAGLNRSNSSVELEYRVAAY